MIARLLTTAVAAAALLAAPAGADIPGGVLKLGVLNDMNHRRLKRFASRFGRKSF